MNHGINETRMFFEQFLSNFYSLQISGEVMIAPAFTSLQTAIEFCSENPLIISQNVSAYEEGAYTGEISVEMLKKIGIAGVILGHSERRSLFAETDSMIEKKLNRVLSQNLLPILCVGESAEERENSMLTEVLRRQIGVCSHFSADKLINLVIAYEPVWAIGANQPASIEEITSAHSEIRLILNEFLGENVADSIRILYGGSVKPENMAKIFAISDVDGALVGGASLKANSFLSLCKLLQKQG